LTWIEGGIRHGSPSIASQAARIATNASSLIPSWTWTLPDFSAATVDSQNLTSRPAGR
jgi:hypothetical protein